MVARPRVVVIGSGWAGYYLAENLDGKRYEVTVISPRRTTAYTPLLASAATGIFNFYLAEDSVRARSRPNLKFFKANVTRINFERKTCRCAPAFDDEDTLGQNQAGEEGMADFEVEYDILFLAPGCAPNTFGTPGVAEHSVFLKNVSDAMKVRKILFDNLEKASLPNVSEEKIKELLHIIVVGGGPTGVEVTAELDDMARVEIKDLYPLIADKFTISIHDVAPNILSNYDKHLHEYASKQLEKRNIQIQTSSRIEKVEKGAMYTKEKGRTGFGLLVWATGNKNVDLIESLDVKLPEKGLKRIQTDDHLRVLKGSYNGEGKPYWEGVYALGDAADIEEQSMPTTADCALQKSKYLTKMLNAEEIEGSRPFKLESKALVSYIGGKDGIIAGKDGHQGFTGQSAWIAWRGSNISWNRNWRSRIMIVITWALNGVFGKEIAKI